LEREAFVHKFSPNSVTSVTEFQTLEFEDTSIAVFNIPGLIESNQAAIDRNKIQIHKAFELRPVSIILYVFGNQGGRIREEDLIAFQAIDQAYKIDREALCFIVNDLDKDRPDEYDGETTLTLMSHLQLQEVPKNCFLSQNPLELT